MSKHKIFVIAAVMFVLAQFQSPVNGQQFQNHATWVPESANVIAMVRIQDLLDSDLGKAEKWRSKQYHSFKSGVATLPTSLDSLMIASQLDLEYMQPLWQVAVMKKKTKDLDIEKVKKSAKGLAMPVEFGAYKGMVVRSDAYVVKVADDTLVAMEPANRQATSRWLSSHNASQVKVTPYLKNAIEYANTSSHFIFAIDLADSVDVARIKARLANSPLKIENLDAVCEVLGGLKGLQMAIRVTDKINGALKVDFKGSPALLEPYAKKMLITALENNGLMIEDFRNWELSSKAGSLVLEGTLSNQGFNEIGTFIHNPLSKGIERAMASGQNTDGGDQTATMAQKTKMYMDAVKDYFVDLMGKKGRSLEYKAKFFEQYAYQIDNMMSPDVDPDALNFGRDLSATLREMSSTMRQKDYQRFQNQVKYGREYEQNANANNNANWSGWDGWYGWSGERYGKYTTERVKDQKRIDNFTQKEVQMKIDVMRQDITKKYTDLKFEMTKKYNTQF